MKKFFKILAFPVVLVLIYLIFFICIEFFYILVPSEGVKIDKTGNLNSAILVIDVQNMLTASDDQKKAKELKVDLFLDSINLTLNKLDKLEAVYIRQEFPRNSFLSFALPTFPEEGEPGTEINRSVYRDNSKIITKMKGDAFTNPELQQYLESKKVGTLYITGLAAEACVQSTVRGAAARGYKVYVVKEAVISMRGGEPDRERLDKYRQYGADILSVKDLK